MGLVLNFLVDEGLNVENEFLTDSIYYVTIDDVLSLVVLFEAVGDPYVNLCLDTDALHPSIHSLPLFTSFCEIDGDTYGTTEAGIHKLEGDTDNGQIIHTGIAWFKTNFGISNKKKFRVAVLEGDIDSVVIKAETETGTAIYPIKGNRAAMGRNLKGRDWDIRIIDFDRLESFELIPIVGVK